MTSARILATRNSLRYCCAAQLILSRRAGTPLAVLPVFRHISCPPSRIPHHPGLQYYIRRPRSNPATANQKRISPISFRACGGPPTRRSGPVLTSIFKFPSLDVTCDMSSPTWWSIYVRSMLQELRYDRNPVELRC